MATYTPPAARTGVHREFDIDRWRREFSLAAVRAERARQEQAYDAAVASLGYEQHVVPSPSITASPITLTSPAHMALTEERREEVARDEAFGEPTPTDVFIWGVGESERREQTKIAGLPYWPKGAGWPATRDGTPLKFVAQVCLADSRDLVPETPGDMLLVFANPSAAALWEARHDDRLQIHWQPLGLTDLVGPDDVPAIETDWPVGPRWAEIYRSTDYPEAEEIVPLGIYEEEDEVGPALWCLPATKIGGYVWGRPRRAGTHIATIESLSPATDLAYPFLDVPAPYSRTRRTGIRPPADSLDWGDTTSVNIYRQGARQGDKYTWYLDI